MLRSQSTTNCLKVKSPKQLLWSSTDEQKKKLLQSKFYFNCYHHGIFTKYFLDAEILFVTSFMCLHVQLVKVLWTVIIKNLRKLQNLKEKDIKDNSYHIGHYFILLISNCYLSINYAYSKFYHTFEILQTLGL